MNTNDKHDNWLVRPQTIRLLWKVFIAVLLFIVLAQFFVKIKAYFGLDDWFGFAAVFGFLACVTMILIAKGLGRFLKRDEHYYDD